MHSQAIKRLRHDHHDATDLQKHESRTRWVVVLTFAMMIGELGVGTMTNSLALTADGWHMATHAGALGLAAFAHWFARTRARETSFSFGPEKCTPSPGTRAPSSSRGWRRGCSSSR